MKKQRKYNMREVMIPHNDRFATAYSVRLPEKARWTHTTRLKLQSLQLAHLLTSFRREILYTRFYSNGIVKHFFGGLENQGLNEFGNLFEALLYYFVFFCALMDLGYE